MEGRNRGILLVAAGLAAVSGLLFGHDTGVISGALLFLTKQFHLSNGLQELVTGMVLIGAVAGAVVAGQLADRLGRRKSIIILATLFLIGSGGSAAAQTLPWLLAGRFIVGFAIGGASFVGPLYIAEISPREIRGALVLLNQLAITAGIFFAYLIDYAFASTAQGWRWMFAVGIVPAAVLAIGMFFLPDSPRWLIKHGDREAAAGVLRRLRDEDENEVNNEVQRIQDRVRKQAHWHELLKPGLRLALLVGIGLAIAQQVTGINTIIYYAPTFFKQIGVPGKTQTAAILAGAIVAAVNLLATIVAIWLVDRVGRRALLKVGLAGMAASLGLLSGLLFFFGPAAGWWVIACMMAYVTAFAIGLGPVFWLLISEIYPLRVRGSGMSIATVFNWGGNLLVALTFLTLFQSIGRPATFLIYAGLSVVAWIFIQLLVPETKGRSLEEIERDWAERASADKDRPEQRGQLRSAS